MNAAFTIFRVAFSWLRANAVWLSLLALGAWTGAALYRRKTNQINSISAALEVERAKAKVKVLTAQRLALKPLDANAANAVFKISAQITDTKKRIAELHAGKPWEEMKDDEIRRALREARL